MRFLILFSIILCNSCAMGTSPPLGVKDEVVEQSAVEQCCPGVTLENINDPNGALCTVSLEGVQEWPATCFIDIGKETGHCCLACLDDVQDSPTE